MINDVIFSLRTMQNLIPGVKQENITIQTIITHFLKFFPSFKGKKKVFFFNLH